MISVIIPLMPVEPYRTQVKRCIKYINEQDTETEVLVQVQEESRYIGKNKLLNSGVAQASGEHIFFCDADFMLEDKTILRRMRESGHDVVFPMFYSETHKALKIADGGVFTTPDIMEMHGKLDESLEGISWVTFPFLEWALDNTDWHCSEDFVITVEPNNNLRKRHWPTTGNMRPIYRRVVPRLKKEGVWP